MNACMLSAFKCDAPIRKSVTQNTQDKKSVSVSERKSLTRVWVMGTSLGTERVAVMTLDGREGRRSRGGGAEVLERGRKERNKNK